MSGPTLTAAPLTEEAFRPFGDLISATGTPDMMINGGRCGRFHDLARLSFGTGQAGISIFRTNAVTIPCRVELVERHPVGSQAFLPMTVGPWLVVVAEDVDGQPGPLHAFMAAPEQGVNYLAGTWHAPLLALRDGAVFAVVDRIGSGDNLQECRLPEPVTVTAPAAG